LDPANLDAQQSVS